MRPLMRTRMSSAERSLFLTRSPEKASVKSAGGRRGGGRGGGFRGLLLSSEGGRTAEKPVRVAEAVEGGGGVGGGGDAEGPRDCGFCCLRGNGGARGRGAEERAALSFARGSRTFCTHRPNLVTVFVDVAAFDISAVYSNNALLDIPGDVDIL